MKSNGTLLLLLQGHGGIDSLIVPASLLTLSWCRTPCQPPRFVKPCSSTASAGPGQWDRTWLSDTALVGSTYGGLQSTWPQGGSGICGILTAVFTITPTHY